MVSAFKFYSSSPFKFMPKSTIKILSSLGLALTYINFAHGAVIYSQEQKQIDVFGNINAAFVNQDLYQEKTHSLNGHNSIYAQAQLGLALRSNITHGLDAIAMALWETSTDQDDNEGSLNSTPYMFVGVDAYQYGTLIIGKGDGAYYNVIGASDIFNYIDSNAHDYYRLGEQRPSQIMYALRALDWDLTLSYIFNTQDMGDTPLDIHNGYAASVSTKFGDNITFAYGFDYYDFDYQGHNNRRESEAFFAPMIASDKHISYEQALERSQRQHVGSKKDYGFALSYGTFGQAQGLYASFSLGLSAYDYLAHHIYTIDTALAYGFKDKFDGLILSLAYGYQKYEEYNLVSSLSLGASYNFNSAFKIFAEAQIDLGGEADKFYGAQMQNLWHLNDNKFALGAQFAF